MDKWNRDGLDSYTGITAQRRNRRRTEDMPESPKEPEKPADPVVPKKPDGTALTEAPDEPDLPGEQDIPETTEEPAVTDLPDTAEEPDVTDIRDTAEKPEKPAAPEEPDVPGETPVTQGPDSRVPEEARRMAAAPYGSGGAALGHTGSRQKIRAEARFVRTGTAGTGTRPRKEEPGGRPAAGRERRPENPPRVNVHIGYEPGRMSEEATRQVPSEKAVRESLYGRDAKAYLEKRNNPFHTDDDGKGAPPPAGNQGLRAVVAVLVVIGLLLSGWMFLKNREGKDGQTTREAPQVISFEPPDLQDKTAPADLTFTAVTEKEVEGIRLRAEGDRDLDTVATCADNADGKLWMMNMHVETAFQGTVTLQVRRGEGEEWFDTEYTAEVNVPGVEAQETEKEDGTGDETDDDYYNEDDGDYYNEDEPDETNAVTEAAETPGPESTEAPAAEVTEAPEEEQEVRTEGDDELPMGELKTPEPTPEPVEITPAPTETPPLVAEAAPEADPSIITNVTVWTSVTKKEKNYARPAKEQIHMPEADNYTPRQFGVMTFRGDNFRRNAAAGAMSAAPKAMNELWKVEAGSARGVSQTYYGYGWTGQPVIARWTTEIKEKTTIEADKKETKALKEVIIAGLDGNVRFLDLADGKFTRSSIKLGYAMRGTPSLHSRGYPFMAVGQYARKMKNKTGMIGMRQYNLYNLEPTKVIDGLDGKYHRPENDVGSFETSALFDQVSDTMICVGTNGALYLESLGSTFDYNLAVMKISPSFTLMTNKIKGVKNKALLAVESSPAAYDKYVFYADMGGVLRCVDTNTLTPVWAVQTGDSVMAAVALDMTPQRQLNLYTANMLNNRKRGNSNVQIRRYDAMSGKEAWCTEIGVYKGKKDKDDVGVKASPVIGQHGLDELVFFTVTGLSDEGRETLRMAGEESSVLLALNKETGGIVWSFGMKSRTESSPIAVYDKAGNGWIVQCEQNGIMHLLDGLTGSEVCNMDLEAQIEASPAAYNNVVVIGTTGKGTSCIYGIELILDKSADSPDESSADSETGGNGQDEAENNAGNEAGDSSEAGTENEEDDWVEGEGEDWADDSEEGEGVG